MTSLVIQNTYCHFETALSLYFSLMRLDFNVALYREGLGYDRFQQHQFIEEHMIAPDDGQQSYEVGFVVSCYPGQQNVCARNESVLKRCENLIYICHRFRKPSDFEGEINPSNALCLSPLAKRIGIDHYFQFSNPVKPNNLEISSAIKCFMQGHFQIRNRTHHPFRSLPNTSGRLSLFLIGTGIERSIPEQFLPTAVNNLPESDFYKLANDMHFLLPCIDHRSMGGTYMRDRFSSNFSLALSLEKPVFCHECFESIYEVPGIYYNEDNLSQKFQKLLEINQDGYSDLVSKFSKLKEIRHHHNDEILQRKVESVYRSRS